MFLFWFLAADRLFAVANSFSACGDVRVECKSITTIIVMEIVVVSVIANALVGSTEGELQSIGVFN